MELYHHGVKGQKWGVRRIRTKAGKYIDDHRTVHELNSIYKNLDDQGKKYVTAEKNPPKKFTNYNEYSKNALNSAVIYNKKKPVSAMTAWWDTEGAVAVSVMTRKDEQGYGFGSAAVKEGMKWLKESGVSKVYWSAEAQNDASIQLAIKNGFNYLHKAKWDENSVVYVKDL